MLTMNKLTMKMRLFAAFLLLGLWGATAQTAREQIAAMPERAGGIYHSYYPFVSREEKMGVNIKYSAI